MNKLVLMIGNRDSGKEDIVKMIVDNYKSCKNIHFIKMDTVLNKELKKFKQASWKNLDFVHKLKENVHASLEKEIIENFQDGKDIILDGYFIYNLDNGYLPILSGSFFDAFKPTLFIFYELYIDKKIPRKREAIKKMIEIEREQEVNRHYANIYSSITGSIIKIIKIKSHGIKNVIKETRDVMDFVLGE